MTEKEKRKTLYKLDREFVDLYNKFNTLRWEDNRKFEDKKEDIEKTRTQLKAIIEKINAIDPTWWKAYDQTYEDILDDIEWN
jgi:uncharacterized coiled-coil protein SlyX